MSRRSFLIVHTGPKMHVLDRLKNTGQKSDAMQFSIQATCVKTMSLGMGRFPLGTDSSLLESSNAEVWILFVKIGTVRMHK